MKEIGYERAMVVHGFDKNREKGMDELSTIGETDVCEFYPDGREDSFVLAPEDVGIQRTDYGEVAAIGNVHQEALRFLKVIAGSDHPACIDLTCLNAGAILYLVGAAADIRAGVDASREIIHGGRAMETLSEWVTTQTDSENAGIGRFVELAREAGIGGRVSTLL
jgi:anthranilate phosphoribosyltransferase